MAKPKRQKISEEQFEALWKHYIKVNTARASGSKQKAKEAAFRSPNKKYQPIYEDEFEDVLRGVTLDHQIREDRKRSEGWAPGPKHLSTFINQRCWEDAIEAAVSDEENHGIIPGEYKGLTSQQIAELFTAYTSYSSEFPTSRNLSGATSECVMSCIDVLASEFDDVMDGILIDHIKRQEAREAEEYYPRQRAFANFIKARGWESFIYKQVGKIKRRVHPRRWRLEGRAPTKEELITSRIPGSDEPYSVDESTARAQVEIEAKDPECCREWLELIGNAATPSNCLMGEDGSLTSIWLDSMFYTGSLAMWKYPLLNLRERSRDD